MAAPLLMLCVSVLWEHCVSARLNQRPIIGVLAQESNNVIPFGKSYIPASYVKILESAGARVAPISTKLTEAEYTELLHSINGVLFPGGVASVLNSRYAEISAIIYNFTLKANDKGVHFPVWAICLGFQELIVLTSGENILTRTNTINLALPLNFTKAGLHSRTFKNFPKNLLQALQIRPLTGHYHYWGVSMKNFTNNKKLNNFYRILTTNMDNQRVEYVSTVEAIKYPIYAVQWHPERSPYEWNATLNIPHFSEAVKVAWYLADFFVNEARWNFNHFSNTTEEEKALIYNYTPMYTGNISRFEQVYLID
ncbi:gamma-glutamyl hydrolase-like isoform X1 [Chiloscyllium plagiosum]|uniref:gamma-glutamyl hydrolase-like isoform X1 n=1 Tax=Chiloscyllium plagiosum TaxID=36176 RepID=UPI001CB873EB|nr:gamma-glutamyl hydrolase-like isoform X1 [Chiloscyllium plagiosum]